jgi:hypothetical protein
MKKLPEHLGGHKNKTHLDDGVLNFMIKEFNITSMLDVGCGPGGMVNLAKSKGLQSLGIDGDFTITREPKELFLIHDFTVGPAPVNKEYDFGWSCEFVEHVDEEYLPNFMQAFQKCKRVVMTYSEKPGHHHVNLKPASYWIAIFKQYGFEFDQAITEQIRKKTTMNITGKYIKSDFVRQNGLFFKKV